MTSLPNQPPQPEGGPSATVEESRAALLAHLISEVRQINQIGRVQSEALQRTADRINRMEERLNLLEQSNRVGLVETTVQFNTLSNSMGLLQTAQQFNELASLREACGAAPIATAATPGGESAASGGLGSMLPPPVPPTARASGGDGAGPSSLSPEAEPGAAAAVHQGILHMGAASQGISLSLSSILQTIHKAEGSPSSKRPRQTDGAPEAEPARCRIVDMASTPLQPPPSSAAEPGEEGAGDESPAAGD